MSENSVKILKTVAKYAGVALNVSIDQETGIVVAREGKTPACGFAGIAYSLADDQSKDKDGINLMQWLEYASVYCLNLSYLSEASRQVLRELNSHLSNKSFMLGHSLSILDFVLFLLLHPVLEKFQLADVRKYINVCRWFENLQQDLQIAKHKPVIKLNMNFLLY